MRQKILKGLFLLVGMTCLTPVIPPGIALILGISLALLCGNPFAAATKKLSQNLLQFSIVGLGAGMNLKAVGRVGFQGLLYTTVGIGVTLALGAFLGRLLKIPKNTATLLSIGTAICGGSAIAAAAPVLGAKEEEISVSLITVFILNAIALFLFPLIGLTLGMGESQFGMWSALAIHDTSSVVGASLRFGHHALEVATTVKLARALWIVPLTLLLARFRARENSSSPVKKPWFILGFLIAAAVVTWLPALSGAGTLLATIAKRTFVLTLFLIGLGLSREAIRKMGLRPLLMGILLWLFVSTSTLFFINLGWIQSP